MKVNPAVVAIIVVSVVVLGLVMVASLTPVQNENDMTEAGEDFSYEKYFDPDNITRVDIITSEAAFNSMISSAPDRYIPCIVGLNGDVYLNVGIKVKGESSKKDVLDSSTSYRHGFKIKADEFTQQDIAGLDAFVLNSELFDTTMMREYLSYCLLRDAGVPTPLFCYAAVYVNGEYWGLYLLVESVGESFIKRNYGENASGELYKPAGTVGVQSSKGFGPDLNHNHRGGHLEYVGDALYLYDEIFDNHVWGTNTLGTRLRMIDIIKHINSDEEDIDDYLDIDRVIAYLASMTVLANLDSYTNQIYTHNFFIYESDGKISLIPWDCDLGFCPFFLTPSDAVNLPIDMPVQEVWGNRSFERLPILEKIIETPEYHEKYLKKIEEITENSMGETTIGRIQSIASLIRPYMDADPNIAYPSKRYFDEGVSNLTKYVELRTLSLIGQLNGTIPRTYTEQVEHPELLIETGDLSLETIGTESLWKQANAENYAN